MFCNGSFSADPLPFANVRCSSLQRTLVLLRLRAKRSLLEAPLGSAYGRCETSFGGSEFSASRGSGVIPSQMCGLSNAMRIWSIEKHTRPSTLFPPE
jgi:hypothetical protein